MDYIAHGISPGQNPGVGRLSLLQGVFPTQGLNPGPPHCRQILHQLSHQGSLTRSDLKGAHHALGGGTVTCD